MGGILVLCTANVCRSVYAAALLNQALGSQLPVAGAGLNTEAGTLACSLVRERADREGLELPSRGSRVVRASKLADSDLVLVMTAAQRVAVTKLLPEARARTMTLIEASVIATELARREVQTDSLAEYVNSLNVMRSRVAMPSARVTHRCLSVVPTERRLKPATPITDGHASTAIRDHARTLEKVAIHTGRIAEALATQAWASAAAAEGNAS